MVPFSGFVRSYFGQEPDNVWLLTLSIIQIVAPLSLCKNCTHDRITI